jgi:hypothetical protein
VQREGSTGIVIIPPYQYGPLSLGPTPPEISF